MAGHAEGESGLEKGWRHGQLGTLWRKGQSLHYEQGEIINHEDEGPLVKSYKNVAELVTEMRAEGREYPKETVQKDRAAHRHPHGSRSACLVSGLFALISRIGRGLAGLRRK